MIEDLKNFKRFFGDEVKEATQKVEQKYQEMTNKREKAIKFRDSVFRIEQ